MSKRKKLVWENGTLTAESAFLMHDTYGFPIELTVEICKERGQSVDVEGFYRLMEEQKERSRQAHRRKKGLE